jgi:predicted porin
VDDPEADDGDTDGISASLTYQTERFYAAIAFDHDIDRDDVNTTRLAGGYTRGPAQLMLLYQHTAARDADGDGFGVSLAWTIGDATAKLQYLDADLWRTDPQPDPLDNLFEWSLSLGLDYALDEGTKLFGFYTTGEIGGTRESHRYAAIGLEHEF